MLHFKVDSREKSQDLFDAFDIYGAEKKFTWEKTYLEVGDVVCGNICIERKDAGDFVGSVMDGRLKEQAAKMFMNFKHKYIIIEGNPFKTNSQIHHNALIGMMASLSAKYGIHILNVENQNQFVYACYSLVNKHVLQEEFNPETHSMLKHKITDEEIIVAMLHQIPGLGYDKAKAIAGLYGNSLKRIMNDINYGDLIVLNGIGKKTAEKIINILNK